MNDALIVHNSALVNMRNQLMWSISPTAVIVPNSFTEEVESAVCDIGKIYNQTLREALRTFVGSTSSIEESAGVSYNLHEQWYSNAAICRRSITVDVFNTLRRRARVISGSTTVIDLSLSKGNEVKIETLSNEDRECFICARSFHEVTPYRLDCCKQLMCGVCLDKISECAFCKSSTFYPKSN
jgi:hypothetical protein